MASVLVAEDDPLQARLVRRCLEEDGHRVRVVHDGEAALAEVRRDPPVLVVLDVTMPGLDGLAVCRRLREEADVAVLMLTALSRQDDLAAGFESGADDYLAKPYSPRELRLRVQALLRRTAPESLPLQVGPVVLDAGRHRVSVDGQEVALTLTEFRILETLMRRPGRTVRRESLLDRVHRDGLDGSARTIDGHVRRLRGKIGADRITTVYALGYRMDP